MFYNSYEVAFIWHLISRTCYIRKTAAKLFIEILCNRKLNFIVFNIFTVALMFLTEFEGKCVCSCCETLTNKAIFHANKDPWWCQRGNTICAQQPSLSGQQLQHSERLTSGLCSDCLTPAFTGKQQTRMLLTKEQPVKTITVCLLKLEQSWIILLCSCWLLFKVIFSRKKKPLNPEYSVFCLHFKPAQHQVSSDTIFMVVKLEVSVTTDPTAAFYESFHIFEVLITQRLHSEMKDLFLVNQTFRFLLITELLYQHQTLRVSKNPQAGCASCYYDLF